MIFHLEPFFMALYLTMIIPNSFAFKIFPIIKVTILVTIISKKLSLINHILDNEIDSNILFSNQLVFGLPIMSNSRNTIYNQLDSLPYTISHLQYIFLHET